VVALPVLFIVAILVALFALLFGELMFACVTKLHLTAGMALACVIAIFGGGLINILIRKMIRALSCTDCGRARTSAGMLPRCDSAREAS
jgi:hypothetical protein